MDSIRFHPWIGARYGSGNQFRKRVLILGESHYSKKKEPSRSLTFQVVVRQLTGEHTASFWTNIAGAFLGREPSLDDKRRFWHDVAFYNYIQDPLPGPRKPPYAAMWKHGEQAFTEVLDLLAPQVVIVLGYRLWKHMPVHKGKRTREVQGAPQTETRRYPLSDGSSCLAYAIRHPSAGFNRDDWYPHIRRVIRWA